MAVTVDNLINFDPSDFLSSANGYASAQAGIESMNSTLQIVVGQLASVWTRTSADAVRDSLNEILKVSGTVPGALAQVVSIADTFVNGVTDAQTTVVEAMNQVTLLDGFSIDHSTGDVIPPPPPEVPANAFNDGVINESVMAEHHSALSSYNNNVVLGQALQATIQEALKAAAKADQDACNAIQDTNQAAKVVGNAAAGHLASFTPGKIKGFVTKAAAADTPGGGSGVGGSKVNRKTGHKSSKANSSHGSREDGQSMRESKTSLPKVENEDDTAHRDGRNPASSSITHKTVNLAGVAAWARANAHVLDFDGYTSTKGDEGDCTDFASRALHIGGGDPETSSHGGIAPFNRFDNKNWYQSYYGLPGGIGKKVATTSWGGAADLAAHLKQNGSTWLVNGATSMPESGTWPGVQPGDVIFTNFQGSEFTGIDHTGIVVGVENGEIEIAQHSTPNGGNGIVSISQWFTGGPDPHVWIVAPAPG